MIENKKSPHLLFGGIWSKKGGWFGAKKRKGTKNQQYLQSQISQFDEQLGVYKESEFQPLDVDALKQKNIFADQENIFEDQENVFEELEVDTQAADYAREQFQQQQANIMQGMRGMAGASGIAGLAQALSGQATKQARETQATIGQQLQQNRRLKLTEQSRLQQQEKTEQARLNQMSLTEQSRLSGLDRQILMANMEGARQFELDKMSTLLGVSGQQIAGAQGAIANKQAMWGQIIGGVASGIGSAIGASDRKLKKDINIIGESPSGLNIYSFRYKDEPFGNGTYQGVMSDEIPQEAVIQHPDGYDMVDYNKIDVDFKKIN